MHGQRDRGTRSSAARSEFDEEWEAKVVRQDEDERALAVAREQRAQLVYSLDGKNINPALYSGLSRSASLAAVPEGGERRKVSLPGVAWQQQPAAAFQGFSGQQGGERRLMQSVPSPVPFRGLTPPSRSVQFSTPGSMAAQQYNTPARDGDSQAARQETKVSALERAVMLASRSTILSNALAQRQGRVDSSQGMFR